MKFHSLCLTALTALTLSLSGCSNDDTITAPDGDTDGTKITFNIGVASTSGDPESRADGEYFDKGLAGEQEVKNAVIIIYDSPLNSKNGGGKIVKSIYVTDLESFTPSLFPSEAEYFDPNSAFYPQSDVLNTISVGSVKLSNYYTKTISIKLEEATLEVGKRYYATAICNFGDLTSDFKPKTSLDVLRNKIYDGKLYEEKKPKPTDGDNTLEINKTKGEEGIKAYSEFRMSGINETSFIWEQNSQDQVNLGDFMVQRLAARLDVMFDQGSENFFETCYGKHEIKLNVYTENEKTNVLEVNNSYSFVLTDLEIVNNVEKEGSNNQNSYMYLIERSSPNAPTGDQTKDATSVVYFDNEGWTSDNHLNATKYVYSPADKTHKTAYSLHEIAGYKFLSDLTMAGAFGNNSGFYANKMKSAIVGYLGENTNSSNRTVLRIKGQTNAPTSGIFTGGTVSRADNDVIGEIPIYHSQNSACMRYGVVRNTIYRIQIKIVSRDNKIYFEWYYVAPDGSSQKPYDKNDTGAFTPNVGENNSGSTIIPND